MASHTRSSGGQNAQVARRAQQQYDMLKARNYNTTAIAWGGD